MVWKIEFDAGTEKDLKKLGHTAQKKIFNYKDDVDLDAKLAEWEAFYNYHRPHGSLRLMKYLNTN